jgi:pimeloyl-ACP methyl ester carboxylesterase
MEIRRTQVRGREARWRVAGNGPPLVLVHGLSGSSHWWDGVVATLAGRYECHLAQLPRFGAALAPHEMPEWLAAWAAAAGLERVRLAGHSLGALAAARLAAQRPDLVEALVLVAPTGMPSRRTTLGYALPLAETLARAPGLLGRLGLDALRTGPEALLRGGLYAIRADVREEVRGVQAPTLLIWGARDTLVPPAAAAEWQQAIAGARLVVLPGAGHVPLVERPAEVAAVLLEFLDEARDGDGGRPVGGVRCAGDDGEPPAR